jgi:hypothetical protein
MNFGPERPSGLTEIITRVQIKIRSGLERIKHIRKNNKLEKRTKRHKGINKQREGSWEGREMRKEEKRTEKTKTGAIVTAVIFPAHKQDTVEACGCQLQAPVPLSREQKHRKPQDRRLAGAQTECANDGEEEVPPQSEKQTMVVQAVASQWQPHTGSVLQCFSFHRPSLLSSAPITQNSS